ncbi:MAG TPA: hypothetical protein VF758_08265 [Candidatus Acidoferrum sp.]
MVSYRGRYNPRRVEKGASSSRIDLFGIMLVNRRRAITAAMFTTLLVLALATVYWFTHFDFDP